MGDRLDHLRPEHLYKTVGLLLLVLVFYSQFASITQILLMTYAAAILGVAFNEVVRLVPVHRRIASGVLGLVIFGLIGLTLWLAVPALADQLRGLSGEIPQYRTQLDEWTQQLRRTTGLNVDLFGTRTREFFGSLFSDAQVLGTARGLIEGIFLPLVLIMGGLYAAADPNKRLLMPLLRAVPASHRDSFRRLFELLGARLKAWVKGTLLSMLIVGALVAIGLWLLGVPYAMLLAVISGFAEIVPLIGPWVSGVIVVSVAFLNDPTLALWAALLMLGIQQVESNIITPMVMAKVAEVHPFVTLFSLFLFATLFGLMGIVLAIPLVLLIWTVVEVLWVERAIHSDHDPVEPVADE